MKVIARKQRASLSVLPGTATQKRNFEMNSSAIKESFHGWLHSVATLTNEHPLPLPKAYRVPRLTAFDVSRVNQVTIREGESHCIWPPSVIEQFNKAEVITARGVEHYVLNDANLTRVESKRQQSTSKSAVLQILSDRD